MQKGNSADSKLYILNQYEPAQDSVMVPDTFLLAESVLFLLKEKNDHIIWTKSALVFLHEPVRSHMFFRTRPGSVHQFKASLHFNPGCSLIGSHKTKNCVTSYMLWELYHGLRTMHTYTVHISCETQHQPAARGNSVRIWGRAVHYGEAPCVSRCVSIANLGQVLTSVASLLYVREGNTGQSWGIDSLMFLDKEDQRRDRGCCFLPHAWASESEQIYTP